jgi:ATP-dependent Clp protease ATP-binding subunit ClpA
MAAYPIPLDHLITYVTSLNPDDGPLQELSSAITVAAQLEEQSDALIGYFVDRARHSGASWSQIGEAMGVSKQAAQKRFVPRDDAVGAAMFSRFTNRARNALAAAGRSANAGGPAEVDAAHITVGLLIEPDGIAGRVIHGHGVTDEQLCTALGVDAAPPGRGANPAALRELAFTDAGKEALRGALKAALRYGHNYIGTEHLLLGVVIADGEAAATLVSLGLDLNTAESGVAAQLAEVQSHHRIPWGKLT